MTASSPESPFLFSSRMLSAKTQGCPPRMMVSAAAVTRQRSVGRFCPAAFMANAHDDAQSGHRWKTLAQRRPRFFGRDVDDAGFGRVGRGENREEHQLFGEWIIGTVNFPHRDEGHFAWLQDAMFFTDPLFGPARNNVDELFARRVFVEGVRAKWIHVRSHQHKVLV